MHVTKFGLDLIKSFEGYISHQYRDSVGVLTIGYGTTEADVKPLPTHLTETQASDLLERKLNEKYAPAINALKLPLVQHQFNALASFIYNVGPGAIDSTTHVGKALRAHQWQAAADHLLDWDRAGGSELAGLKRRREAERRMFLGLK